MALFIQGRPESVGALPGGRAGAPASSPALGGRERKAGETPALRNARLESLATCRLESRRYGARGRGIYFEL